MFEIECTINTSVPMQPTKVYLETNFPLSFIQEKKKFINSQFEWKVPSLYFESSAAAKPSLCGSCLSIRVIVLTVVSIIELLRWAAAADKSPFALVIGASWVRVRFSDSATGRPLKMCYLLCNATIQMKLWGVWSFLKDAKSAAGPYVVGRRVSSHGPAFLCPLICDLSIFSPTLLQGLVALPALF